MSYMICEKCHRHYPLDEGKSSFNYEKCECGGKLRYSSSLEENPNIKPVNTSNKIKFTGVIIGFILLFLGLIVNIIHRIEQF